MTNPNPPSDFGPEAPVVDSDRIDHLYTELSKMHVELDSDPLEFGPKRLNQKIAECRAALSKCEGISLQVSQDLHWYKRRHRLETATHALKVQELLSNDPEVRAGRNVTDREAVANIKLRSGKELIDKLHFAVEDMEAVLTVVRTKRADLKDIQGRLKDQLKVCQEEISLGARWGSRVRAFVQTAESKAAAESSDSLDSLMDDVIANQAKGAEDEDVDNTTESSVSEAVVAVDEAFSEASLKPVEVAEIQGTATDFDVDDMLAGIPDSGSVVSNPEGGKSIASEDLDSFFDDMK